MVSQLFAGGFSSKEGTSGSAGEAPVRCKSCILEAFSHRGKVSLSALVERAVEVLKFWIFPAGFSVSDQSNRTHKGAPLFKTLCANDIMICVVCNKNQAAGSLSSDGCFRIVKLHWSIIKQTRVHQNIIVFDDGHKIHLIEYIGL